MKKIFNQRKRCLTQILSILLVFTTIFSTLTIPASAAGINVHDVLFDWQFYYATNNDVARVYGKNPTALRSHYESFGKREGRAPSKLFNPKVYLSLYSDLRSAFKSDYTAAYNHFVSFGINESRQGSSYFSVSVYKANYADLRNHFGDNNLLYLNHYRQYGEKENRNAITRIASSGSSTNNTTTSNTSSGKFFANGYYTITSGNTYGINVQYAPASGIGNMVLDPVSNLEKNEVFLFQYNESLKAYYITPKYRSDSAINALYGKDCKVGSQLKLHPSNLNDTASLWYVEKSGSGYKFKNVASGLYITVNGSAKTGTALVLKKSLSGSSQVFKVNSVSSGSVAQTSSRTTVWPVGGNGGTDQKNWPKYNTRNVYHSGTDISAPVGTPVYATYSGVVYKTKSLTTSYGKHVIIKCNVNNKTVYIYYCHLNSYSVREGQTINAGQQIGTVGKTGNASGPHLHYEVRNSSLHYGNINNPTLNPYDYLPVR